MKKHFTFIFAIALSVVSCAVMARPRTSPGTLVRPFSVVCKAHIGYGPNSMDSLITFARRSDASYVRTYTDKSPYGEPATFVEILDTRKRTFSVHEPFTKLVKVIRYSQGADAEMWRQARFWGSCKDYEARGAIKSSDTILGYQIMKSLEFSSGNSVLSLVAPALDCFPLKLTIAAGQKAVWEQSESMYKPVPFGTIINEQIATKIDLDEPPDSLFAVSPEYSEASDEQISSAYGLKHPGYGRYGYHVMREELIYGRRLDSFLEPKPPSSKQGEPR